MAERAVDELVGVYHADGGVLGELRYVAGRLTGRTHCSLCDITHSGVRRRPQWDDLVAELGVGFRLVHLNERDPAVGQASAGATPCVLARSGDGLHMVMAPADLEALGGDLPAFVAALRRGVERAELSLP